MTRGASQGGAGDGGPHEAKRTRSQRGKNRNDVRSGFQTANQQAGNRAVDVTEFHQLVDRQVKALLNKLKMNSFDLISDQIIDWANKSEQEKDGSTLAQVIKLVFEKAKNNEEWSEMYARLCRKMMERISPNVQDETVRNAEGQPIRGGMLFRKYLLNRCQEDFERGWSAKRTALVGSAFKTGGEAEEGNDQTVPNSDEHLVAAQARRKSLGVVRLIGELFKLRMLTERIMHECIKKLLSNVVNPEDEEIESLCKLLTTVGQHLDTPKARNHMDIYFERMQEMSKGSNVNSRMQQMLLDVIELRARQWHASSDVPQLRSSNQGRDQRDGARRRVQYSGSRREPTDPDGWDVASGTSPKQKKLNVRALFQGGGVSAPTVTTPSWAPRDPGSGFERNDPANSFPRGPQTSRPSLTGTQSGSTGPRPAGSPRMAGAVPLHQTHHQVQQQWPGYYPPQGYYDPYMYWQHQQHPHQHHLPQLHTPPRLPSTSAQTAERKTKEEEERKVTEEEEHRVRVDEL